MAGRLLLVVLVLGLAGVSVWLLTTAASPSSGSPEIPALAVTAAPVQPGSVVPGRVPPAVPQPQAGAAGTDPLRAWANRVAGPTQIPARALIAYGNAELALRSISPGCHVSWTTLAGIGRIESNHGQFGGATLGEDGRSSTPIARLPLDGTAGPPAIPDTDGGTLDGDPRVARA